LTQIFFICLPVNIIAEARGQRLASIIRVCHPKTDVFIKFAFDGGRDFHF
jgi:hypothetical protein